MTQPRRFVAMRRRLRERGLIDNGHRLTPAGEAWVRQAIASLRGSAESFAPNPAAPLSPDGSE